MAKMRSPNYPAIGLGEALKALKQIWDAEKRTAVGIDVIAKAMGYNSVSGPARTKVAALRKYGLLDQHGGHYQVSQLGLDALHGQPDTHADALRTAAMRPESFRELFSSHADASDAALRSHLITRMKFSDAGAQQFIKAFRETLAVAKPSGGAYIPSKEQEEEQEELEKSFQTTNHQAQEPVGAVSIFEKWTLSIPRNVKAELRVTGDVTRADITRLKKQIEFLENSFDEESEERA